MFAVALGQRLEVRRMKFQVLLYALEALAVGLALFVVLVKLASLRKSAKLKGQRGQK